MSTKITNNSAAVLLMLLSLIFCMAVQAVQAESLASIENLAVSPRIADESSTDSLDVVATGINIVGISKTVYLQAIPSADAASSITSYAWGVTAEPSAGDAVIEATPDDDLFKFVPGAAGSYTIELTPLLGSALTTPTQITIFAAGYAGVGNCGFCHNGGLQADKMTPWAGTGHATKLQRDMDGENGLGFYSTTCLNCHAAGAFIDTIGDSNFLEVAGDLSFDLSLIVDAVTSSAMTYENTLPEELKDLANITCESCHGPGDSHMGNKTKIAGPNELFNAKVCGTCHDAPPHHLKPYQWASSHHAESDAGRTRSSCVKCHTSEGFVEITVRGKDAIDSSITTFSPVNCVTCHDPHDATNVHQLRKIDAVTIPNGTIYDSGLGNLCVNCHNSRRGDLEDTVANNRRGLHYGPQAEMFLGEMAYAWDRAYPAGQSIHYLNVADGCITCHMGEPPADHSAPPTVGGHTFRLNDDDTGTSTALSTCGTSSCHSGLSTTDRVPRIPRDFDGDGSAVGVQTEVRGLLANLETELIARLPEGRLSFSSNAEYHLLSFDQKAALYNFKFVTEDSSFGIHNPRFIIAILQRSYLHLTDTPYDVAFPSAFMADSSNLLQGPPELLGAIDAGDGTFDLTWRNNNLAPSQFLALVYDLYAGTFVNNGGIWNAYRLGTGIGTLSTGLTGGYMVWLGNQYGDGTYLPDTAMASIMTSGTPHTPLELSATLAAGSNVNVSWKTEKFGTFANWLIVYDVSAAQWISVGGPLGDSIWQYVAYGSAAFTAGSATLTMPGSGTYFVFVANMAWDGSTLGQFAATVVSVP